jgi:6-phosphogluconolactonase (cycloisomerase 2 family)
VDSAGRFAEVGPAALLPAGSGPRHLVVVHDHMVVAAELSGELWLGRRTSGGGWTEIGLVPSTGTTRGEELYPSALRADGNTVFVANRGPGTVGAFALDPTAGTLTLTWELDGGGRWPRDLVVTDDWLWVANQTDDVVTLLPRGHGAAPTLRIGSPTPACVLLPPSTGDSLAS